MRIKQSKESAQSLREKHYLMFSKVILFPFIYYFYGPNNHYSYSHRLNKSSQNLTKGQKCHFLKKLKRMFDRPDKDGSNILRVDIVHFNDKSFGKEAAKVFFEIFINQFNLKYFITDKMIMMFTFNHYPKKALIDYIKWKSEKNEFRTFQFVYNDLNTNREYETRDKDLYIESNSELMDPGSLFSKINIFKGKEAPEEKENKKIEKYLYKFDDKYSKLFIYSIVDLVEREELDFKVLYPVAEIIGVPPYYYNEEGLSIYCRNLTNDVHTLAITKRPGTDLPRILVLEQEYKRFDLIFRELADRYLVIDNYFSQIVPLDTINTDILEKSYTVQKDKFLFNDKKMVAVFDQGNKYRVITDRKTPCKEEIYKVYLENFPEDIDITALFHIFDDYSPVSIEKFDDCFILYVSGLDKAKRVLKDFEYNAKRERSKQNFTFRSSSSISINVSKPTRGIEIVHSKAKSFY